MDGQVLGGGVIVLVAVVLWLVYLLPSWQGRHAYSAAERNAVRLNQALRVLAETSETPEEVRLELNARTALAQQKLARRAQSEREERERDNARIEAETAHARARAEAVVARHQMLAERDRALAEVAAAKADPQARRARARRRTRLAATGATILGLGVLAYGILLVVQGSSAILLTVGAVVFALSAVVLMRMNRVQRRAAVAAVPAVAAVRADAPVQDIALDADRSAWTPRSLPRPLTVSAGSRAATVLDEVDAREALRHAAVEEAMRTQAERQAPAAFDAARRFRAEPEIARGSDDATIEEHVRALLERRASGQ